MDFNAMARSNYFKVKDRTAFDAWCQRLNMHVVEEESYVEDQPSEPLAVAEVGLAPAGDGSVRHHTEKTGRVAFLVETDHGTLPSGMEDPETGEWQEFEFEEELLKHLADGEIAVWMEAGAEGLRYIAGEAYALRSNGDFCCVSLNDIYAKAAQEFGVDEKSINRCEY
jgi:hypothetical protein